MTRGAPLSERDAAQLAELLRGAERSGDLGAAYRVLQGLSPAAAAQVALQVGHSTVSPKNRAFWPHLQGQIAAACRGLCDGFELRVRSPTSTACPVPSVMRWN